MRQLFQTFTIAWNTLMFRFDDQVLSSYPRWAVGFSVGLIFFLDCMMGKVGLHYFGYFTGFISGVMDVAILLVIQRYRGYQMVVASTCAVLVCEIMTLLSLLIGFGALSYIMTIWLGIVFYKIMKMPRPALA